MSLVVISRPVAKNPLSASWWPTPLPDNATLDTTHGPAAITELVRQAGLQKPNLNVWTFTAERYYATQATPKIPVTCTSGDSHLNAAFAEGVPIPAGAKPTNDSDATLLVYQEDSEHGGTYWELWKAKQDPTTGAWSCAFGGRMTNANARPAVIEPPRTYPREVRRILTHADRTGCRTGKVGYTTRRKAVRVLETLREKGGAERAAYRCPHCQAFHLTSRAREAA